MQRRNILRRDAGSTLVTVGALLGVEVLRRDPKHVVALDADAVQRTSRCARRLAGPVLIGRVLSFGHAQILPHGAKHRDTVTRQPRHMPPLRHLREPVRVVFTSPRGRLSVHFVGTGEFRQVKRETAKLWLGC